MSKYQNIDVAQLAAAFKALAHPNRLKIYLQLLDCCTPATACAVNEIQKCCAGDLGSGLGVAPSTLSHHIKELTQAGLLQMSRRGQHIDYWVNPEALEIMRRFFASTRETN